MDDEKINENIIFQIISCSGEARSFSMEAIQYAKKGEIEKALGCIGEADQKLAKAHKEQTKLIQSEAAGQKVPLSLLLIHAQDHLMNAITVKDMAQEFVDLYETINRQFDNTNSKV